MSFKDVYLKFVDSYQQLSNFGTQAHPDKDDLEMPCFYLRNESSIALFKIDAETHSPVAELIPSHNLEKLLKDALSANVYTVHKIYEEDAAGADNAAAESTRKVLQSTLARNNNNNNNTEKTTSVGAVENNNNFEDEDGGHHGG